MLQGNVRSSLKNWGDGYVAGRGEVKTVYARAHYSGVSKSSSIKISGGKSVKKENNTRQGEARWARIKGLGVPG